MDRKKPQTSSRSLNPFKNQECIKEIRPANSLIDFPKKDFLISNPLIQEFNSPVEGKALHQVKGNELLKEALENKIIRKDKEVLRDEFRAYKESLKLTSKLMRIEKDKEKLKTKLQTKKDTIQRVKSSCNLISSRRQ